MFESTKATISRLKPYDNITVVVYLYLIENLSRKLRFWARRPWPGRAFSGPAQNGENAKKLFKRPSAGPF